MFYEGNLRLGPGIWTWSLPAKETCPGSSAACELVCYGLRGHYSRSAPDKPQNRVYERHVANWELSRSGDFVKDAVDLIRINQIKELRVHAVGDFYSADYIQKWRLIAERSRRTAFLSYTRSWHDPAMLAELELLAAEPNFHLWFSCDQDTGQPPRVPNVRYAYLKLTDADDPAYWVDLCFRDRPKTVMKWNRDGILVCPKENRVTKVTCSNCRVCYRDKKVPHG